MRTAAGPDRRRLPPTRSAKFDEPLTPIGSVYAGGEEWTARHLTTESLERGTPVRILRQEGLTLLVEPARALRRAP